MAVTKTNDIDLIVYQACLTNPTMDETQCEEVARVVADDFIIDENEAAYLETLAVSQHLIGTFQELGALLAKIQGISNVADQRDDGKVNILK